MDRFSVDSSEKKNDIFLPEHTNSMRKALAYCQQLMEGHTSSAIDEVNSSSLPTIHLDVDKEAQMAARTISEQRQKALTHFWERQQELFDPNKRGNGEVDGNGRDEASMFIEAINLFPESPWPPLSAVEFRKRFQNSNQPCLIRGLDQSPYFSSICSKWRVTSPTGEDTPGVNRDWFLSNIGRDTKVPVRFQPCSSSQEGQSLLDNDGRAVECATKEMCLHEWTHLLDEAISENPTTTATKASHHYLKDWHLQSFLRIKGTTERPIEDTNNGAAPHASLYDVPPYFQHDLLNAFLTKFTDTGDYMFVYWGPRGSRTSLHSDVMNSFSWSFNVAGSKKWVFYPPSGSDRSDFNQYTNTSGDDDSCRGLVITQNAGECIFVPCGWRHEVTNNEETLSINHNWVTTSNIDQTWECLCLEMKAIENELKAWDIDDDCWDARESMLRGCVGLDVTAFFLMLLTRLLELMLRSQGNSNGTIDGFEVRNAEESIWQWHFDVVRLRKALNVMLSMPELERRLAAVLCCNKSATTAMKLAELASTKFVE